MVLTKDTSPALEAVLRPHLRNLPILVGLGIVTAALEGVGIGLVIPLLQLLTSTDDAPTGGLASRLQDLGGSLPPEHRAGLIVGAILALFAVKNAFLYVSSLINSWIYGKSGDSIRLALTRKLTRGRYAFVAQCEPGRLLNILSSESWRVADALQARIAIVIGAVVCTILAIFLMILSWQMTLSVGLGIAIIQIGHELLSRRLREASLQLAAKNASLSARMLHIIHAARLIRIFNQERLEEDKFANHSNEVRKSVFALDARKGLIGPAMELILLMLFLGVVLGAWSAGRSFPTIAAFLILLYRLQPQVRGIQGAFTQLDSWNGSIREVSWLMDLEEEDLPDERRALSSSASRVALHEQIEFRKVCVSFGSGETSVPALQNVSFTIRKGRSTAIVGASGSGKTTVVNLLGRLLEPDSGEIRIDSSPLASIDVTRWRETIAVASQDLELFDGSVADNIAYGNPSADRQAIIDAARRADIHDFISGLPDGYDSPIGYLGKNLSAGQRQRLVLARALVRQSEVLIMDEATNALDAMTEERITETLRSLGRDKTLIVISHHLSSIRYCDDLIVLDQGRVRYAGSFAEQNASAMEELLTLAASAIPEEQATALS